MIRCYLTGVESALEDAYVFNRRGARDRLEKLKAEVASLTRLYGELAPLDDKEHSPYIPEEKRQRFAPKQHRLVCKAVATALRTGFPEVNLFLTWEQYRAQVRKTLLQAAPAIPATPPSGVEVTANASLPVSATGHSVLQLLDPRQVLPAKVRNAVAFGAVFRLPGRSAQDIARLILAATKAADDINNLGFAPGHLVALRTLLAATVAEPSADHSALGEVASP